MMMERCMFAFAEDDSNYDNESPQVVLEPVQQLPQFILHLG